MAIASFTRDYVARTREFSRNARLYVLHVIGMDMIHGSWTVLFNLYLLAIGFDVAFVGSRLAIQYVARALTALPAGLVADRIGRKASFILGDGMGAIFGLVMINTRSEALLLGLPAAQAFFDNLHHTAEPAFMAENSRPAERVHLFSVAASLRTFSAMTGALLAGAAPLLLADRLGTIEAYRLAVYAGLALWFASLLPALLLRSFEATERPEVHAPAPSQRSLRGLFAGVRHRRRIGYFVLSSAIASAGFGAVGPLFNVVFHEGHVHAQEGELGVMFAAGELALALATLAVPLLAARMLKVDAIALTRVLAIPFVLAMGLLPAALPESGALFALVTLAYVGRATTFRVSQPLDDAFNMEVLDARERATATGLEMAAGSGVAALSIYLGSRLIEAGDFVTPFLLMAGCYAISTAIYWRAFRPLEVSERAKVPRLAPSEVVAAAGDA